MRTKRLVDPGLHALLDLFPTFELSADTLPAARERTIPFPAGAMTTDAVELTRRAVPGPAGAPDVSVAVYAPRDRRGPLPSILHIHGGGYVLGSSASLEMVHRSLAEEATCAIVSVDYRLAPETPFPGAIEDCYAALAWVASHAAELGIDARRIGVMGESAGGGLAAALSLLVRDRHEYSLAFQHLIYPMLDDRTCTTAERHPYVGEFIWTPNSNAFGWASLLGIPPGSEGVSPYAAAARAIDLADLPPAFVSTGALDLFLEEDIEYARRLMRHGVPVELHVYPGAYHGFDLAMDAPVAVRARRDSLDALKRALHSQA